MREKIVLYETKTEFGSVKENHFNQEQYEKERNIIRFCICKISREWQEILYKLLDDDKNMHDDIIKEELDRNETTLFCN